jgi:3-dehydroquinate synthase
LRAILNFGHTVGHAIEAITKYRKYLHGEALAIGQVAAAKLSEQLLGCPADDVRWITTLIERTGLPTQIKLNRQQSARLFAAMQLDKKVSGGEVKFVLAEKIGKVKWGQNVPQQIIEKAI